MGYIGDNITHLLTIDPNFLGHPSTLSSRPSDPEAKSRERTAVLQGRIHALHDDVLLV